MKSLLYFLILISTNSFAQQILIDHHCSDSLVNISSSSSFQCKNRLVDELIAKLVSYAKAQVGVSALILETGDTLNYHGDEKFPMQSVYKFPIALAVLHQVEMGELSP